MKALFASLALVATLGAGLASAEILPATEGPLSGTVHAKAPVGSTVLNAYLADGRQVHEVYRVNPDHSLTLVEKSANNN